MNLKKVIAILFIVFIIIFIDNKVVAEELNLDIKYNGEKIEMISETPNMEWNIEELSLGSVDETILNISNIGTNGINLNFMPVLVDDNTDLNVQIIKLKSDNQIEEEFLNSKYSQQVYTGLFLEAGESQSYKIITSIPEDSKTNQIINCKIKLECTADGAIEIIKEDGTTIIETSTTLEVTAPKKGNIKLIIIILILVTIFVIGIIAIIKILKDRKKKNEKKNKIKDLIV